MDAARVTMTRTMTTTSRTRRPCHRRRCLRRWWIHRGARGASRPRPRPCLTGAHRSGQRPRISPGARGCRPRRASERPPPWRRGTHHRREAATRRWLPLGFGVSGSRRGFQPGAAPMKNCRSMWRTRHAEQRRHERQRQPPWPQGLRATRAQSLALGSRRCSGSETRRHGERGSRLACPRPLRPAESARARCRSPRSTRPAPGASSRSAQPWCSREGAYV